MAGEYEKRHNPIWPELAAVLKAHGVCRYSIFLHPGSNQLFGYLEVEEESRFERIAQTDICRRWWRHMTEVLECERPDSPKGREDPLREVFHLD
jgi:L-rhamnose mutarotase